MSTNIWIFPLSHNVSFEKFHVLFLYSFIFLLSSSLIFSHILWCKLNIPLTLQSTTTSSCHHPLAFLSVSHFSSWCFSWALLHQKLSHFPPITPLSLWKIMMFQIGFTLPPPFFFSSVLYCVFTIFSPSFSYNMSVSEWAFHCGALGSRFLLNCSITVRVLLYILSRQTVQLVTQYIINTLWCCLYFHPKKYNHKYLKVIFQWCEALLDRCNYMLPGLSPLASLWLQSPLATQYTHSAARRED